jgi:hemoglobin-like flavoprotein
MVTARQKLLIGSSWELMRPMGIHVADLFYDRLFELDPLLEERFPEDSSVQRTRFLDAISATSSALDDLEGLQPGLHDLGRQNRAQGVEPGDYVTLGKALLWTFEQTLAEDFTPLVRDAWATLYAFLSGAMIQGGEVRETQKPREHTQLSM